jgi:hypothetical protein
MVKKWWRWGRGGGGKRGRWRSSDNRVGLLKKKISKEISIKTSDHFFLSRTRNEYYGPHLFLWAYKSHDNDNIFIKDEWDLSSKEWKKGLVVVVHVVEKNHLIKWR